jgi:hypothetical protein
VTLICNVCSLGKSNAGTVRGIVRIELASPKRQRAALRGRLRRRGHGWFDGGLPALDHAAKGELIAFERAAHASLEVSVIQPRIARMADEPCFFGSRTISRVPVIELGAGQSSVLIADRRFLATRTEAIAPGVRDLEVNLLRPPGQWPALHRQTLPEVLHLSTEHHLPRVNPIELVGKDVDYVLEREGLLRAHRRAL